MVPRKLFLLIGIGLLTAEVVTSVFITPPYKGAFRALGDKKTFTYCILLCSLDASCKGVLAESQQDGQCSFIYDSSLVGSDVFYINRPNVETWACSKGKDNIHMGLF